jgi:hypothetical protein
VAVWCGGALLSALSLLFPRAGRYLYLFWVYLSYPLGLLVSYALFALAFYGIFAPLGSLMKVFGYDPLRLNKRHRDADSNWTPRAPSTERKRYFDQY